MVKTSAFNAEDVGSIHGWEAKISYTLWPRTKKKKKKSNRRNIDLKKIGPHQKQTNRKQTNKNKDYF